MIEEKLSQMSASEMTRCNPHNAKKSAQTRTRTNNKSAADSFPAIAKIVAPLSDSKVRELIKLAWNDTGNAERLAILFGRSLFYCPEAPKGHRWYAWTRKCCKTICEERMYDFVSFAIRYSNEIYEAYARNVMPKEAADEAIANYNRYCITCENLNKIKATIDRSSSLMIKHKDDLDKDPMLLNVANGILNLETGRLLPHDPSQYCTHICRASYNPGSYRGSLWEKTLSACVPDPEVRRYLQMYGGYMLTGKSNEAKVMFLVGAGGSGKTTFLNALHYVMGNYSDTLNQEILLASKNNSEGGNSASPSKAKLAGLRAVMASETDEGRRLNEAQLKNLTGGDIVTARFLYGQEFSFQQTAKMIIASNYMPNLRDVTDGGIRRRLVIIRFDQTFTDAPNINLEKELQTPPEAAAILDWLVQGTLMWVHTGRLPELPASVKQTMAGYYDENDWLSDALGELTVDAPQGTIKAKTLIDAIKDWLGHSCHEMNCTRSSLVNLISKRGYSYNKIHGTRYFRGLTAKNPTMPPTVALPAPAAADKQPLPASPPAPLEGFTVPF